MKKIIISLDRKFQKEERLAKKIIGRLDHFLGLKQKHVEIYLVSDQFMKKNVLAFPAPKDFPRPDLKNFQSLGEIYLNPSYIKANNEDFVYMLVHGFLHLLGYNHKIKSEADQMEAEERKLLSKLTI
jgi:probable rRNA maturation factor